MEKIKIDDVEYSVESLPEEAKAQIQSIQYVDSEIRRLQFQLAALKTARVGYGRALKSALNDGVEEPPENINIEDLGESIQFD